MAIKRKDKMKKRCVYSDKPIGNKPVVIAEHAVEYVKKLGYLVSNFRFLFMFLFLLSFLPLASSDYTRIEFDDFSGASTSWIGGTHDTSNNWYDGSPYQTWTSGFECTTNYTICRWEVQIYLNASSNHKIYPQTRSALTDNGAVIFDEVSNSTTSKPEPNYSPQATNIPYGWLFLNITYDRNDKSMNYSDSEGNTWITTFSDTENYTYLSYRVGTGVVEPRLNSSSLWVLTEEYSPTCSEVLTNTSWSEWLNSSCYPVGNLTQSRFLIEYDSNNCGFTNVTYYEYQNSSCVYVSVPPLLYVDFTQQSNIMFIVVLFTAIAFLLYFRLFLFASAILSVVGFLMLFSSVNIVISLIIIFGGVALAFYKL